MTKPPTPEQLSALGRYLRSQRTTPPVQNLQPCKHCGELLGTNARRKHLPVCKENPKNRRAALKAKGSRTAQPKSVSQADKPAKTSPAHPRTPFRPKNLSLSLSRRKP